MKCRKKWILPLAVFFIILSSVTIYFANPIESKPAMYFPREVKIHGVHLADSYFGNQFKF